MTDDPTDRLLVGWDEARPDLQVGALQVTARLSRIGPHLARRQEEVFSRFGLNRGEVGALSALRIAGPPHQLSPTRLAKGLMLSSAGVTSRIDRLERRGFVRRLDDPNDRRGVIIELTDEGLAVVDAAVAANSASDRQLLERLEPTEIETLEGLLRKLLGGLELPD
ncbi:MAG TPA: MarR family transcriptional regulator [Verrucomicrobiae bacterium]|jgi:DNA-binding MarR family transcriptional regulator|nr:MarR family transcriptional regulator [Verrucomicrobiae bacterium]